MKDINRVMLTGTIVGMRSTTKSVDMFIATDGGSARGRKEMTSSFPSVSFSNTKEAGSFKVGDRVSIQGHIHCRLIPTEEGKRLHILTIQGDVIKRTKRMLAEYVDVEPVYEGGFPDDKNLVVAVGTVERLYISPNGQYAAVTLTAERKSGKDYITAFAFRRQAEAAKDLKEGDKVAIAGAIRNITSKNSDSRDRQSFLILDIAKLEDKDSED